MATLVLIPGINPQASKGIFDAIRKDLPKAKFIELTAASEEQLMEKRPDSKFVLVGKSMGGKVALEHQLKHKDAAALVLLAPAVEADEKFGKIKVPALIVHGTADSVISIDNSRKMNKIIASSKLIEIKDADHSYRGKEAETIKAVAEFINRLK
jgi:pimeloyl-ACP methyl ester carboxylesterase